MKRAEEKSVNEVTLSGLLQGVVLRQTGKGDAVANATLVLINGFRTNGAASQQFIRATFWRGLATKAVELPNHSKVRIGGRIETESWIDQSGNKKTRMVIVANSLAAISELQEIPIPIPEEAGESSAPPSIGGREFARAMLAPPKQETNSAAS
jgi:single-stranded DNA-binding protein